MAQWKKLIVSGALAELNNVSVDNAVTASAFKGDGSALTNIAGGIFGGITGDVLIDSSGVSDIQAAVIGPVEISSSLAGAIVTGKHHL